MTITPGPKQFLADNWLLIIVTTAAMIGTDYTPHDPRVRLVVVTSVVMLSLALIVQYLQMSAKKWTITGQNLCSQSGILSKKKDYIELYRIVDYAERQSLMQNILRIKTVTVMSTDKSDPQLDIIGVPYSLDLVGFIRNKVELCKQERKIYEITNN